MKQITLAFAKKIRNVIELNNDNNIGTDSFISSDREGNKYLYLYFKDRANFQATKDPSYKATIQFLHEKEVRYATPMKSEHKCLIWIPIDQSIDHLVEEELFPVKKYKKKVKK